MHVPQGAYLKRGFVETLGREDNGSYYFELTNVNFIEYPDLKSKYQNHCRIFHGIHFFEDSQFGEVLPFKSGQPIEHLKNIELGTYVEVAAYRYGFWDYLDNFALFSIRMGSNLLGVG